MKIIIVWYFITNPTNNVITWSPPFPDEQECFRVANIVKPQYPPKCFFVKEAVK